MTPAVPTSLCTVHLGQALFCSLLWERLDPVLPAIWDGEVILICLHPPPQCFLLSRTLFRTVPLQGCLQRPTLIHAHLFCASAQALWEGKGRCESGRWKTGVRGGVGVEQLLQGQNNSGAVGDTDYFSGQAQFPRLAGKFGAGDLTPLDLSFIRAAITKYHTPGA